MRLTLLAAIFVASLLYTPVRAEPEPEIVILTGSTGGVYYPLGIALARIYERAIPGSRVVVQATQASVENFNLLQQRRGTLAFGQGESALLMKDGQIDAVIISAGLGVKALMELAASVPVDIVPIPPDVVSRSKGAFTPVVIPPDTYAGQTEPIPTAALNNFLVTHRDVPEQLVYSLTKALYANLAQLQEAHVAATNISARGALSDRPIALHPGAARYFREAGLLN
jgi:TRAP-type uncharacterized transport system substrate-binding protein